MLTHKHALSIFATGLIVPVLKKSTLHPGNTLIYRPLTMSSTFVNLLKLLILHTDVSFYLNQLDFLSDYSVSHRI
jgi:hypothetical protein